MLADVQLMLDVIAGSERLLREAGMDMVRILRLCKGLAAIIRIEVQEDSLRAQYTMPFPIGLHHVRQRPRQVAAQDDIEALIREIQRLCVHLPEACRDARRKAVLPRFLHHLF